MYSTCLEKLKPWPRWTAQGFDAALAAWYRSFVTLILVMWVILNYHAKNVFIGQILPTVELVLGDILGRRHITHFSKIILIHIIWLTPFNSKQIQVGHGGGGGGGVDNWLSIGQFIST